MPAYGRQLSTWGLTQGMSRRGNCLDNAAMESFFTAENRVLLPQRVRQCRRVPARPAPLHSLLQPPPHQAQTQRPKPSTVPNSGLVSLASSCPTSWGQFISPQGLRLYRSCLQLWPLGGQARAGRFTQVVALYTNPSGTALIGLGTAVFANCNHLEAAHGYIPARLRTLLHPEPSVIARAESFTPTGSPSRCPRSCAG